MGDDRCAASSPSLVASVVGGEKEARAVGQERSEKLDTQRSTGVDVETKVGATGNLEVIDHGDEAIEEEESAKLVGEGEPTVPSVGIEVEEGHLLETGVSHEKREPVCGISPVEMDPTESKSTEGRFEHEAGDNFAGIDGNLKQAAGGEGCGGGVGSGLDEGGAAQAFCEGDDEGASQDLSVETDERRPALEVKESIDGASSEERCGVVRPQAPGVTQISDGRISDRGGRAR
ncbi:MAG: hypothetical protein V2A58_17125 [Planctomycetota bacterium]